jgi:hypothetical protein
VGATIAAVRRAAVLGALISLLAAGTALAVPAAPGSELSFSLDSRLLEYGSSTGARGRLVVDGSPRAGGRIRVELDPLPALSGWIRAPRSFSTGPGGRYSFAAGPPRSYRIRAVSDDPRAVSPWHALYVIPRLALRYRALGRGRFEETLTATGPPGTRLTGRVYLYRGRYGAKLLPFWRFGTMRPVGRGVSRAVVRFGLPTAWKGSFRFAACYDAPRPTGLDDPRTSCSKRPRRRR